MSIKLKLYQASKSPNSRRVRIVAAEKDVALELVEVDLGAKAQFADGYRSINARSVVPTLVLEDGTAIGEVPAIIGYIEALYPEPNLLGTTPGERAQFMMWERWAEQEGFAPAMEGVRNDAKSLQGRAIAGPHPYAQIPDLVERSKMRVANFYADLDKRLVLSPFVGGNRFSVADITALVAADFAAKALGTSSREDCAAFRRWYDAVSSRASATA